MQNENFIFEGIEKLHNFTKATGGREGGTTVSVHSAKLRREAHSLQQSQEALVQTFIHR